MIDDDINIRYTYLHTYIICMYVCQYINKRIPKISEVINNLFRFLTCFISIFQFCVCNICYWLSSVCIHLFLLDISGDKFLLLFLYRVINNRDKQRQKSPFFYVIYANK